MKNVVILVALGFSLYQTNELLVERDNAYVNGLIKEIKEAKLDGADIENLRIRVSNELYRDVMGTRTTVNKERLRAAVSEL